MTHATIYDNTRLSEFRRCPRAYFIRHVMGWTTTGNRDALVFGSGWHAGQDIIWEHGRSYSPIDLTELAQMAFMKEWEGAGYPKPTPFNMDKYGPRTPGTAKEMFFNYTTARWKMIQESEVIGIERPFAVPIPGMPGTMYCGRLDKVVRFNGKPIVLEHKTTAMYAVDGGFRNEYVMGWYSSNQVKGYQFGGRFYFDGLREVWVDCALVHKKHHNVFKFVPVAHNNELLTEWINTTATWAAQVTEAVRQEKASIPLNKCFPKNEDSCYGKFGACAFLELCRAAPDPRIYDEPPAGFVHEPWEPFDILGLDKLVKEGKL